MNLSLPQLHWILMNIGKDELEELERFKILLKVIHPQIDFDGKEKSEETINDDFLRDAMKHSKENFSIEELKSKIENPPKELINNQEELDIIERVE